jgi:hypothetical protein
MPVLPTRLERSIPQGRRPVVRVNSTAADDAAIESAGMVGRGLQNIAGGLDAQARGMQRAQDALDENDYYDAKGKFLQAKVEQDNAFDNDADWGTYEKRYSENMGRVRGDLIAALPNAKLRRRFEQETQLDLAQGAARIKSMAFDRETKDGIDNLNLAVTDGVSSALKARDEKTRASIINGINGRIDAAAKAGYITVPGSKLLKRKTAQSYAQQYYDLKRPEEALAELVPGAAPPKPGITQMPLPSPEIEKAVKAAPKNDQAILARIAELESKGDPNAVNPTNPDVVGLFQFSSKTADEYGLKDRTDPKASTEAAARLLDNNRTALRGALNREPTPAELYLAHQQGASGAAALLSNADQPAIVALTAVYGNVNDARRAILQNGGTENMTAGQFTSLWTNKFNGGNGEPIGRVLAGEIPEGGWDFSQPNGTLADVLDPSVRGDLIAKYAKAMQDQAKTARQAAQVSVSLGQEDAMANAYLTGDVDNNYVAQAYAAYGDERAVKLERELNAQAQAGRDHHLVATQSIPDDIAMLKGAEAAAGQAGPGSAAANARYAELRAAIAEKHKAIAEDPAGYVAQNDPVGMDAYSQLQGADMATQEGRIEARMAIAALQERQKEMGIQEPTALPDVYARGVANSIEKAQTPKDQYAAFVNAVDVGDDAISRQIIADIGAAGTTLPSGAEFVANLAIDGKNTPAEAKNRALGEKLWSEMRADVKGVDLKTQGKAALASALQSKFGAVVIEQAKLTGDADLSLLTDLSAAVEQVAKARVLTGADPTEAVKTAYNDLTAQFALISDPDFAQVFFPAQTDAPALGAGLEALRREAAGTFPDDPYSQATARDIAENGVWVNEGSNDLVLRIPGSTRVIQRVSIADAVKRGRLADASLAGYGDAVSAITHAPTPGGQ